MGVILVTGASGLLGLSLLSAAVEREINAVAVYHRHPLNFSGVETVQADLAANGEAAAVLVRYRPEWVIHCAAATDLDWCEDNQEEAWRTNVQMTRSVALASQKVGARLIYISTDSVFDGRNGNYSEEDQPAPVNAYARSKLAGERAVREILEDASVVIRTNFYGFRIHGKPSLADLAIEKLQAGEAIHGFTDVFFTPILAYDLSQILFEVTERGLKGLYHIAGSESRSKCQFLIELAEVFGLNSHLVRPTSVAALALRAARPRNTSLKTTKISNALGKQMPDVRSGLRRLKELQSLAFAKKLSG